MHEAKNSQLNLTNEIVRDNSFNCSLPRLLNQSSLGGFLIKQYSNPNSFATCPVQR